jgi:signal transduction histidine kinase
MAQSLRMRLFLNGLIIMLVGMGLAGFLFWRTAEQLYIKTQTENLLAQARLTAAALQDQPLLAGVSEPYSQVSNTVPGIHTRVLSMQGAVVISLPLAAESLVQMPDAENSSSVTQADLLQRPEIISAMQGREASAVRKVPPNQRRVLYAAAPILAENGSISGLIYLAVPLPPGGLPGDFFVKLIAAGLAAAALALLAGTLLSRQITRPVSAIMCGANAVSGGERQQQLAINSKIRELDDLGQVFNQMVASLRQSDQAKEAFVADVAHELRTPLTVIKGTIETLEDGALDDLEGRGPLLSAMQRETERLIRLVNDLLVLTRASSGMLKVELKTLDLGVLAQQRCDHLLPLAAWRGVIFTVTIEGSPCVLGDQDRLMQVLDNLLENAMRYSPDGGTVRIKLVQRDHECSCSVHDGGPGIPPQHVPYIFERFYRVEASRNRQSGGAGLGLAIVQALLQAQGGRISVESQPGQGTTFCFYLPSAADCHPVD